MSVQGNLAGIELLSNLDGKAFRRLEKQCRYHKFDAKQIILNRADDDRHDVFFILEGTVRIVNHSRVGREIAFANIHAGGYFGELAALTDQPRSASVVAVTNCELASLSPKLFQDLLLGNPKTAIRLMTGLGNIIHCCDDRVMDLSTLTAVQRVHAEILRRAKPNEKSSNGWAVSPMPKHNDIASVTSTTRETVVRAMKILNTAGIADRKGQRLDILDYDRLSNWVKDGHAQVLAAR